MSVPLYEALDLDPEDQLYIVYEPTSAEPWGWGHSEQAARAFARLENHYFTHRGFLPEDGHILKRADRLRDIPGVVIICPSNGHDAVLLLREAVRLAREEQRIVVMVEPIALYMTRDLHAPGDGGWTREYPAPGSKPIKVGQVGVIGDGTDLAIVTYGNGTYLSCQAQKQLAEQHGIKARIIDMRWLAPLPQAEILENISGCRSVLIVDECRRTGSQSEGLMALMAEHRINRVARITAEDCFIATGPAYAATLPSADGITCAAQALCQKKG